MATIAAKAHRKLMKSAGEGKSVVGGTVSDAVALEYCEENSEYPAMISLSDNELAAVMEAARPIPARDRDSFLGDVAVELEKNRELLGTGRRSPGPPNAAAIFRSADFPGTKAKGN